MTGSETRKPAPDNDGTLTTEEIEAILAAEGASPPEADQPAPRLDLARREPGQGRFGVWLVWVLVAFIVMGAIKAYL